MSSMRSKLYNQGERRVAEFIMDAIGPTKGLDGDEVRAYVEGMCAAMQEFIQGFDEGRVVGRRMMQ